MIESAIAMAASGGGSAVLGAGLSAVGKLLKGAREAKNMAHARDLEEMKAISAMMNEADNRGGTGGDWIRRFMVISIFAFMFVVLPINYWAGYNTYKNAGPDELGVPRTFATFVHKQSTGRRWLGIFPGKTEVITTPIEGLPVFDRFVEMGWLIGCFYFGASRIK